MAAPDLQQLFCGHCGGCCAIVMAVVVAVGVVVVGGSHGSHGVVFAVSSSVTCDCWHKK